MSKTPKKSVAEAEAAGDPTVRVKWQGLSFDVPRDRADWTLDAELAARADDPIAFAQAMMPADVFDELRERRPKNRDVAELSAAIVEALGFTDSGESPASSD